MGGLDTLREVAVRSSEAGRLRVDVALLHRERAQLLETLGEIIVDMIDDQSFEDVPESVKQAYERIKDVDRRMRRDDSRVHHDDPRFHTPADARKHEPADDDLGDDVDQQTTVAEAAAPAESKAEPRTTTAARRVNHR